LCRTGYLHWITFSCWSWKNQKWNYRQIHESDIEKTGKINRQNGNRIATMKNFILPGGHETVSFCHISRCVCRRAERLVVELDEKFSQNPLIIAFLNRLSDYLFVYGRYVSLKIKCRGNSLETKIIAKFFYQNLIFFRKNLLFIL